MIGINGWELLVLSIIALLVLGPDKLPKFAADAGRFIRQVRRMANDARAEVTRELGPELQDLSLQNLDPRRFVSRHLLDGEDLDLDADERPAAQAPAPDVGSPPAREQQRPPYDADAT